MFEEKLEQFIENLKEKFQGYFIGLGAKARGNKYIVNVIIDDRDVKTMNKRSLYSLLQKHIDMINNTPDRIKIKPILVSDINKTNIWSFLGNFCYIIDVKSLLTFVNIKFPKEAQKVFKKLSEKFKLKEFRKGLENAVRKRYHRNTYQGWLRFLKKAGLLELKNKTYYKIQGRYKEALLERMVEA